MNCIWCRKITSVEPEEHIFPDSLGCPDDLVLQNGEDCGKCNGKNGRLDQALVHEFDIFRLLANVPNKRGAPPQIATRANAEGGYRDGAPYIHVNMERAKTVAGLKRNLRPFRNRPHDFTLVAEDNQVTLEHSFCNSKECVRALHKIAFEVFAQKFGVEEALTPHYDAIRDYVMRGKGDRTVLMAQAARTFEYRNFAAVSDGSVFPKDVVMFQLVVVGFSVDLSPTQSALPALKQKHAEVFGTAWTWAPIQAP